MKIIQKEATLSTVIVDEIPTGEVFTLTKYLEGDEKRFYLKLDTLWLKEAVRATQGSIQRNALCLNDNKLYLVTPESTAVILKSALHVEVP